MAINTINIGAVANDGTGDPIRTAFDTVNDDAEPVLLYLQGDVMVGYYDDEMKQGFTA